MLNITFQKYEDVKSIKDYEATCDVFNFHADRSVARFPWAYADFGYKGRVINGEDIFTLSNINIWDRKKNNLWVILADDGNGNYAFEEGTVEYDEFVRYAERQMSRLVGYEVKFF